MEMAAWIRKSLPLLLRLARPSPSPSPPTALFLSLSIPLRYRTHPYSSRAAFLPCCCWSCGPVAAPHIRDSVSRPKVTPSTPPWPTVPGVQGLRRKGGIGQGPWNPGRAFSEARGEQQDDDAAKYLRRFFLRIHPDVIDPIENCTDEMLKTNVDNIARFNALTDMVNACEDYEELFVIDKGNGKGRDGQLDRRVLLEAMLRNQVIEPTTFEFFYKVDEESKSRLEHVCIEFRPPSIPSIFSIGTDLTNKSKCDTELAVFLNYFYRFLSKLLKESGIDISSRTQTSWQRTWHNSDSRDRSGGASRDKGRIPRSPLDGVPKKLDDLLNSQNVDNEVRQILGWPLKRKRDKKTRVVYRRRD